MDTHYSVEKNIHLLGMRSIHVQSLPNGEIDYRGLKEAIAQCPHVPPIIVANIGTTMKGAVDSILDIQQILSYLKIQEYYLHCDAALFGMLLPFLPPHFGREFDFSAGIDSLAISGHKMIGMPIPCGILLTKQSYKEHIVRNIEYTGAQDSTILGSRNGFSPLLLWYEMIWREGQDNMCGLAEACIRKAEYTVQRFKRYKIFAWSNHNSVIVLFPRPSETMRYKWQLAVQGELAHIITLPHLTYKVIDQFVEEVASDLGLL
jgi:histidine decarboxylase